MDSKKTAHISLPYDHCPVTQQNLHLTNLTNLHLTNLNLTKQKLETEMKSTLEEGRDQYHESSFKKKTERERPALERSMVNFSLWRNTY